MAMKSEGKNWQKLNTVEKFFGTHLSPNAGIIVQKDETCEVCGRRVKRNNPNQIQRYHTGCRTMRKT